MANFPYYLSDSHPGVRKGIIESHEELAKSGKTIYKDHPLRISLYTSFKYRGAIDNYFFTTVKQMETITDIERLKKKELFFNISTIGSSLQTYTNFFTLIFGALKVFKLEPDWKYKHQIIFLPDIPFSHLKTRFFWAIFTCFLYKYNSIVKDLLLGFYYPDLLCDLQIGKEYELGYWSLKFAEDLTNQSNQSINS